MGKRQAPIVRNLLAAVKAKMALKGAESEEIVIAFEKQHPEAIAKENADLVRIALMKIVGPVGSRRAAGTTAAQLEMFEEYSLPNTVLFRAADGRKIHRFVQSMTTSEGREHVAEHTKPRSRRLSTEVKELVRLLDDVEPHKKSERSTIGECWIAYQATRKP